MVNCCVPNCRARAFKGSGISFHKFPLESELRNKWILAISCEIGPGLKWTPTVVCSRHFHENEFSVSTSRKVILPSVIPSVFNKFKDPTAGNGKRQNRESLEGTKMVRRSKRLQARQNKKKRRQRELKVKSCGQNVHQANRKSASTDEKCVTSQEEIITVEKDATIVDNQETEYFVIHEEETPLTGPINSKSYCRLCASSGEDLLSVFEDGESNIQILDMIHSYLPILMTAEDLLPTTVCVNCITGLDNCHNFVQGCLEADSILRTMFGLESYNELYDNIEDNTIDQLDVSEISDKTIDKSQVIDDKSNILEDYSEVPNTFFEESQVIDGSTENKSETEDYSYPHVESFSEELDSTGNENLNFTKNCSEESVEDISREHDKENDSGNCSLKFSVNEKQSNTEQEDIVVNQENSDGQSIEAHQILNPQDNKTLSTEEHAPDKQVIKKYSLNKKQLKKIGIGNVKNPKFKVVIMKMKNGVNFTHTDELKKTVQLALNAKLKEQCLKQQLQKQEFLPELPSKDNSILENAERRDENIIIDHTYTLESSSSISCQHCQEKFNSKESYTWHQQNKHPDMQSNYENYNTICSSEDKPVEQHEVNYSIVAQAEIKEEIKKESLLEELNSGMISDELKNAVDVNKNLNTLKNSELRDLQQIQILDIDINTENITGRKHNFESNLKCQVKFPKEFDSMNTENQTKILTTINKLITKSKIEDDATSKDMKVWECETCKLTFPNLEKYISHRLKHPRLRLVCPICNKIFYKKSLLNRHLYYHSDEKKFMCEICGKQCKRSSSLRTHLMKHEDDGKEYKCIDCEKIIPTKTQYVKHVKIHQNTSCLCEICGKSFKYTSSLKMHMALHNKQSQHICKICGKTFQQRTDFEEHLQLHNNNLGFECNICGKKFKKMSHLNDHKLVHANLRLNVCYICDKGFNLKRHLQKHIKNHQRERTYTCRRCKMTFPSVKEVLEHSRIHPKNQYRSAAYRRMVERQNCLCHICGRKLATKVTLENHLLKHLDIKPFSCNVCKKSFNLESRLEVHKHLHSDEKPFPCKLCRKSYLSRKSLETHERLHTEETPYECKICNKIYYSKQSLSQHMLFHMVDRPYKCLMCDNKFKRQDILKAHIRTHTGERPYSCKICGQKFKQRGVCTKHEKRHLAFRVNDISEIHPEIK